MELSRRELLKLLGVSAGAAAGGAWGASALLSVPQELFERITEGPHIETWKTSVCSQCPGGCGIRVRLIDGVPVRVLGNPLYPINHGAVCPMAEASIEALFHPNRIRGPLRRTDRRGNPQWEPISWEEALATIGNRLQNLRQEGKPEKLGMFIRDENELLPCFADRFMKSFGSPNLHRFNNAHTAMVPVQLTQGTDLFPVYDLARTDMMLNFGSDLLDAGPSPVRFNQLYAEMRSRERGVNPRIVHIGPYLSRTAVNSSEWIPIKLGTMGALALSIANVMVKDGSFDEEFIDQHAFGFQDWHDAKGVEHRGFKSLVTQEYYPEKASELTGIAASKIVEIAREFAAAKSALAIAGDQVLLSTNSLYSSWSIYCLNVLKGNFERPGGVLFRKPMPNLSGPEVELDTVAEAGLTSPKLGSVGRVFPGGTDSLELTVSRLVQGSPYEIDTLILHGTNPLLEAAGRERCQNALEKVPFIISCTPFLDETSSFADLILPEPVFLERWGICLNNPAVEFLHFGVQQPIIEPLYDSRHFGDLLLEIGRTLGDSFVRNLPWENYESFIKAQAQVVFNSGEGDVVSESEKLSWIEFLRERGFRASDYATFEEFWEVLLEKGGWWDPVHPGLDYDRILKTPSGRFEFYSRALQDEVDRLQLEMSASPGELRKEWRIEALGDHMYLPHFEPPRFEEESLDFPLHLLTYRILSNSSGSGGRLALLQEMAGVYSRDYWESWVEMNPETAAKFGIHEGDRVEIASPQGRLVVKARLLPTVMPETVVMPLGLGMASTGSQGIHTPINPLEMLVPESERATGVPSFISTKVNVRRISRSMQEEWRAT